MMLLTLRGTPVLYYGDEIGMTRRPTCPATARRPGRHALLAATRGRDGVRTPMQWTARPAAGSPRPGSSRGCRSATCGAQRRRPARRPAARSCTSSATSSRCAARAPTCARGAYAPLARRTGAWAWRRGERARGRAQPLGRRRATRAGRRRPRRGRHRPGARRRGARRRGRPRAVGGRGRPAHLTSNHAADPCGARVPWQDAAHANRSPHRRGRLPRPERGDPRRRPRGRQPPRPRDRRLPLRVGGRARAQRRRPHAEEHVGHPAPRRHDPRHVAHEPVQGRRGRHGARARDARARRASTR